MILTTSQANDIYQAMCIINNYGGRLFTELTNAGTKITVNEDTKGQISVCDGKTHCYYKDQAEFKEAYGLL